MTAPDSYDALAASIERAVRTDIAPPGSATHLAGSIDRIMHDEACAGETRLSYLRLAVVAPFTIVAASLLLRAPRGEAGLRVAAPVLLAMAWLILATPLPPAPPHGWGRGRGAPRAPHHPPALGLARPRPS